MAGLGKGLLVGITHVYIAEIAPSNMRGMLIAGASVANVLGDLYEYCFGYMLHWDRLAIEMGSRTTKKLGKKSANCKRSRSQKKRWLKEKTLACEAAGMGNQSSAPQMDIGSSVASTSSHQCSKVTVSQAVPYLGLLDTTGLLLDTEFPTLGVDDHSDCGLTTPVASTSHAEHACSTLTREPAETVFPFGEGYKGHVERDASTPVSDVHSSLQDSAICSGQNIYDQSTHYVLESPSHDDVVPEISFPSGRYICDLGHFVKEIRDVEKHTQICCYNGELVCTKIQHLGLSTRIHYACSNILCSATKVVSTEENKGSLNKMAVLGAIFTGSGMSQEEEKFQCMNVSYMSHTTFANHEKVIGNFLKLNSVDSMNAAIALEKRDAELRGDIDGEGYYCISAVMDGGWSKRSYGHGYNACSGVAVIIGTVSKKILFMGIRNKLCLICKDIESGRRQTSEHVCSKTWSGSSTGMESAILLEGFKYLEETHRVRCMRLVGDGDANTMVKVQQGLTFGSRVQKVECANHACRRYRRALERIQKNTQTYSGPDGLKARKMLLSSIPKLVCGARTAIRKNAVSINSKVPQQSLDNLIAELRNGPNHVFGNHDHCGVFCSKPENDSAPLDLLQSCDMLTDIERELRRVLLSDAKTLIFNCTNNAAESFMSLMCKCTGGKRVDYSKAGGYQRRAHAAVLAYQRSEKGAHAGTIKGVLGRSPGNKYRLFVAKRMRVQESNRRRRLDFITNKAHRRMKFDFVGRGGDLHYGDHPQTADKDDATVKDLVIAHMSALQCSNIPDVEVATRGQWKNVRWVEERGKRISSSFFKDVFTRKEWTRSSNLVKRIVYNTVKPNEAMRYGLEHEKVAIADYVSVTGNQVMDCGLFLDADNPFLCTSPDGLVLNNGLVEIKCPFVARNAESLQEVANKHNIGLQYKAGLPCLTPKHKYYFQVQGQLAITNRQWCDVYFWCPKDSARIRITRDVDLWRKMIPKLEFFYMNCVLPELLDPRFKRQMPLREPQCILDAIEARKCHDERKVSMKKLKSKSISNVERTPENAAMDIGVDEDESYIPSTSHQCERKSSSRVETLPSRPRRHIVAPRRLDL